MASSEKHGAGKQSTLQERLSPFLQETRESEANAAGKADAERDERVAQREEAAAQREDETIGVQTATAENRELQTQREDQISSSQKAAAERAEGVAERDEQITELQEAVAQLEGKISSLQEGAVEREEVIAKRDEVVAQLEGEISHLREASAEHDRRINERNELVAEHNEVVARLEGEISSLKKAAAERDERFVEHNEVAAWRKGNLNSLREAVAKRDEVVAQREIVTPSRILGPDARTATMLDKFLKRMPSIRQRREQPQYLVPTPMPLLAIIGKSLAGGLGAGAIVFAVCFFAGTYLAAANLVHFDGFVVGSLLGPFASVIGAFLAGLCQIRRASTLPTWGVVGYGLFLLLGLFVTYAGYILIS